MSDTLRETYIQGVINAFRSASVADAIERSLDVAFTRGDGDVVIVHRGKELPDSSMYGVTDRECDLCISVLTRNSAPDQRADQIMVKAHPIVMHFTAAGIMDIIEGPTDAPKYANTDGKACLITTHYTIHYRTLPDSLSA